MITVRPHQSSSSPLLSNTLFPFHPMVLIPNAPSKTIPSKSIQVSIKVSPSWGAQPGKLYPFSRGYSFHPYFQCFLEYYNSYRCY